MGAPFMALLLYSSRSYALGCLVSWSLEVSAIISSEDSTSLALYLIGDYVEVRGLSGLGLALHVSMLQIL